MKTWNNPVLPSPVRDLNPNPALFPTFEDLSLKHQTLIENFLRRYPPEISEMTFTNLFIWRHYYQFQVSFHRGFLTFMAHPPETSPFLLPPLGKGDLASWALDCLDFLKAQGFPPRLSRLPESALKVFSPLPNLKIIFDRNNSDYVYRTQNLIRLSGNKYHTLKNHINRLNKKYAWEYLPLTPELIVECLDLQEEWCRLKQCVESPSLLSEEQAIIEALTHIDLLNYKGGVIRIQGKVEAFTLGELLNPETVVIHIEKGNPELSGLYPLIQQQFLDQEWGMIPYVNREQDLGIQGLRKAKSSYHPEFMINKYIVI
ncbi:MAG: phosphatidylglycerol lysyltransferase domain-containing protein [Thermodesulfobacteriota bacterium]